MRPCLTLASFNEAFLILLGWRCHSVELCLSYAVVFGSSAEVSVRSLFDSLFLFQPPHAEYGL